MTPEQYMTEYLQKRGYTRRHPTIMAHADLEFQRQLGQLADYTYKSQRRLSAREKELALIAALAAGGAGHEHLQSHLRKALDMGLDRQDLLECLELVLVPCGLTKFEAAVEMLDDLVPFVPPSD
jgi:alkylhydroperoxidase/carboxymuconolactone decarboxylase family protein YurZ